MKKLFIVFMVIMLAVYPLAGCQSKQIYISDNVAAVQVDPLSEKEYSSCQWMPLSEEEAYRSHPIIVTGTVKNIREVQIDFTFKEVERTEYITIFDLEVENFLHNSSTTISSNTTLLTIGYAASSRRFPEGVPVVKNGKEFLLFCQVLAERNVVDPQNKEAYIDCWVFDPYRLMLEKTGEQYVANRFWGTALNDDNLISAQQSVSNAVNEVFKERTESNNGEYKSLLQGYSVDAGFMEKLVKEKAADYWQEMP